MHIQFVVLSPSIELQEPVFKTQSSIELSRSHFIRLTIPGDDDFHPCAVREVPTSMMLRSAVLA